MTEKRRGRSSGGEVASQRSQCSGSGADITVQDVAQALDVESPDDGSGKRGRCNKTLCIKEALAPTFKASYRVTFSDHGHEARKRQDQAVALGEKIRALRKLQPSLSFDKQAVKTALRDIGSSHSDWHFSGDELDEWVQKTADRLLNCCRFVSQAEYKLRDGRRAPPWLSQILGDESTTPSQQWIFEWNDLEWQATRRPAGAAPGVGVEVGKLTPAASGVDAPVASWDDGTEWEVPNVTSDDVRKMGNNEATERFRRDGQLDSFPCKKDGSKVVIIEGNRFGKKAIMINLSMHGVKRMTHVQTLLVDVDGDEDERQRHLKWARLQAKKMADDDVDIDDIRDAFRKYKGWKHNDSADSAPLKAKSSKPSRRLCSKRASSSVRKASLNNKKQQQQQQ